MGEPYIKSNPTSHHWERRSETFYYNGTQISSVKQSGYHLENDSLVGEKNPRWRQQIARGENASTPYVASRNSLHTKRFRLHEDFTYDGTPNPYWQSGFLSYGRPAITHCYYPQTVRGAYLLTKADNRARTEFVRKARDFQTATQGGVQLGELANTLRQMKSPLRSLRNGVRDYQEVLRRRAKGIPVPRTTRSERIAKLTEIAADTWLESTLGFLPFISDLRDGVDHILGLDEENKVDSKEIAGYGEEEAAEILPQAASTYPYSPYYLADMAKIDKIGVKYAGRVGTRANAAGYAAQRIGLDPSDVLPTVWELVPYSFIVDYFVNIGDIISGYAFCNSSLWWIYKNIRTEASVEWTNWKPQYRWPESWWSGGYQARRVVYANQPGAAKAVHYQIERITEGISLVPTIEFSLPGTSMQWLNLAALSRSSEAIRKLVRI